MLASFEDIHGYQPCCADGLGVDTVFFQVLFILHAEFDIQKDRNPKEVTSLKRSIGLETAAVKQMGDGVFKKQADQRGESQYPDKFIQGAEITVACLALGLGWIGCMRPAIRWRGGGIGKGCFLGQGRQALLC